MWRIEVALKGVRSVDGTRSIRQVIRTGVLVRMHELRRISLSGVSCAISVPLASVEFAHGTLPVRTSVVLRVVVVIAWFLIQFLEGLWLLRLGIPTC